MRSEELIKELDEFLIVYKELLRKFGFEKSLEKIERIEKED